MLKISKFSSVHKWPVYFGTSFEQLPEWLGPNCAANIVFLDETDELLRRGFWFRLSKVVAMVSCGRKVVPSVA